jgi:splicing factor, arginine/serine-rich 18
MFSNPTKEPDSPTSSQWPLNPTIYQNMANNQVDWASLAQQWIHMKEAYAPGQQPAGFPSAPPPPPLSGKDFEEKGEAPMEVEKDEEPHHHQSQVTFSNHNAASQRQSHIQSQNSNSNNSNNNNNKNNNWTTSNSGNNSNWNNFPTQNLAHWKQSGWNTLFPGKDTSSSANTTTNTSNTENSQQSESVVRPANVQGYWTTKTPTNKIPSLLDTIIEPNDPGLMLAHARMMATRYSDEEDDDDTTQTIDAAKRKILPAWIREGLEKMEREKQKQVEREEELREREMYMKQRRKIEEEALKEMENEKNMIPSKSKFVSIFFF